MKLSTRWLTAALVVNAIFCGSGSSQSFFARLQDAVPPTPQPFPDHVVRHGSEVLGFLGGDTYQWTPDATWSALSSQALGADVRFATRNGVAIAWNGTAQTLWQWSGSQWVSVSYTGTPPTAVFGYAFAGLPSGDTVLFGGMDSASTATDETWFLTSGNAWNRLTPASSPLPTVSMAAAVNAAGELVIFGGWHPVVGEVSETWTFDGTNWTQLFPSTSPSPRQLTAMALCEETGDLVLMAGFVNGPGAFQDAWLFDGVTWSQVPTTPSPLGYGYASGVMVSNGAYHPGSKEIVFPTLGTATAVYSVWGTSNYGSGCTCSAVAMSLFMVNARIGTFTWTGVNDHFVGDPLLLLYDAASASAPFPMLPSGCTLYVASTANWYLMNASPAATTQQLFLWIPNSPALIGGESFWQAVQPPNSSTGNPGCASNGVRVVVGR